ncbi:MAG TPA: bifunctional 4-hydroxy-2-oxoglutarate aldolase/2-dehydro-3-deoxy-phosphogluconate aldolase [Bryobacteraceae bacterium]|nr:bifunctional 4-hydroxy-2-oxoglutarate aldolase/2-dehydro-3-deoxy-phosphogluconate aldolase [Bryobacteraceae bacterium]
MTRQEVHARIEEIGIIPSVRLSSAEDAMFAAEAVREGGIPIVEVTMTIPGAIDVIRELARNSETLVVGAGSIWDVEVAARCLDAGARFLTSTGFDRGIVEFAQKHDTVVFPGTLTPSEVMAAWKAGVDFVKIFPCANVGGPSYIKALRRPFPQIRMIAGGGVNQQNAGEFILQGATAIGVGADLIQPQAIKRREASWIQELAGRFVHMVQQARDRREGH